jgi:hypothetical protein
MEAIMAMVGTRYKFFLGSTHGPQIAPEVDRLFSKISQKYEEWEKFLKHIGYHPISFLVRF